MYMYIIRAYKFTMYMYFEACNNHTTCMFGRAVMDCMPDNGTMYIVHVCVLSSLLIPHCNILEVHVTLLSV